MKNIIVISIIVCLLSPNFSFAQKIPETMEEAGEFGEKLFEESEEQMPGLIERMWNENILPIWQKMWNWLLSHFGSKIKNWLKPEVEKRKSFIKESFPGEKQEMQQETKSGASYLWNKFKELIK